MKSVLENLASLLKVKTLVTLAVIAVFVILALRGEIGADNVMIIISMVVSFYFGTQHEKSAGTAAPTGGGRGYTEAVPEPAPVLEEKGTHAETTMDSLKPPDNDAAVIPIGFER